jgi:CelD/BcsL family acetyltransferase involved in cellulose biosynthesis
MTDLESLKDEWNRLVLQDSSATLFQSWEWNWGIWNYINQFNSQLCVFIVRTQAENELVAVFPLRIVRRRVFFFRVRFLEWMTGRNGDYQQAIVVDDHMDGVFRTFSEWMTHNPPQWDIADFKHIRDDWKGRSLFPDSSLRRQYHVEEMADTEAPYLPLDSSQSLEVQLKDMSIHNYLKRKTRKMFKDFSCQFETIQEEAELQKTYPVFVRLNRMRSTDKLMKGFFRNARVEEAFSHIAVLLLHGGFLRFHILRLNGQPAACLFNLEWRNKRYFYQSGLDAAFQKYSVGHVIHGLAIDHALHQGNTEYDFLCGTESYKTMWTKNRRVLRRTVLFRSSRLFKAFQADERFRRTATDLTFLKRLYFLLHARPAGEWRETPHA